MIRLTWTQPEDLLAHGLAAARDDGRDVAAITRRWQEAGGAVEPPVSGATPRPASDDVRALARELLDELDAVPRPDHLVRDEPEDLAALEDLWRQTTAVDAADSPVGEGGLDALADRVHGGWLGRAAGCLLGKPVEKISREGIRAILESTGDWPLSRYFTGVGLDPAIAERHPWNRRSAATSLRENIAGMPEDDDLNFPLIALGLLESVGRDFGVDDVARAWLAQLPGGRVFTAERVVYRNLLDGYESDVAGGVRNPFRDWIGGQIRTDVYGWVSPGDPAAAARMAWNDARLSHGGSGLYGALFVAAACSVAVVASDVDRVLDSGLSVIPPASRYATAIRFGRELAASSLDDEAATDEIVLRYGRYHWVHALNNSCLLAFALARGGGDFTRTITTAVSGGWDTDSIGATAGSITGALTGATELPASWIEPLANRLTTSIPGFDGIGFDELRDRTLAVIPR